MTDGVIVMVCKQDCDKVQSVPDIWSTFVQAKID